MVVNPRHSRGYDAGHPMSLSPEGLSLVPAGILHEKRAEAVNDKTPPDFFFSLFFTMLHSLPVYSQRCPGASCGSRIKSIAVSLLDIYPLHDGSNDRLNDYREYVPTAT